MSARSVSSMLFVACVVASAAPELALGQPQPSLRSRVTINVNTVSPRQVFEMIGRAVGCTVVVDPEVAEPVTIRMARVTARTALNAVCESVGCRWRLDGKTLRVDPEADEAADPSAAAPKGAEPRLSDPLPSREPVYLIGNGITAPVLLRETRPYYTQAAKDAKTQGQVEFEFVVLRDGTVSDARVVRSLSPELDEEAVKAVRQWLFRPAQLKGRPVAVRCQAQMTFTLRDDRP